MQLGLCRRLLCRPGCNRLHILGQWHWRMAAVPQSHNLRFVFICKGACLCRSFPPGIRVACLLVVEAACILVLGRKTVRLTHEPGVRSTGVHRTSGPKHRTPYGGMTPDMQTRLPYRTLGVLDHPLSCGQSEVPIMGPDAFKRTHRPVNVTRQQPWPAHCARRGSSTQRGRR